MAFPTEPYPLRAFLDFGTGTLTEMATNLVSDVRGRDDVVINRGRPDESSTTEPSTATLTLDNRSGKYSPRNPVGQYYGQIGRNAPLQLTVDSPTSWLVINAETGNTPVTGAYVSTPDAAALDITGDIDIRFDADLDSWRESMELVGKWTETGNQRSYQVLFGGDGTFNLYTSTDGTAITAASSQVPVPFTTGRGAIRVTLDVDDGAGNRVYSYYTSDTINGTWTLLNTRTLAGTTSIFSGSAPLRVLDNPDSTVFGSIIRGRVYAAQVRNSIGGTVVANPDFTAQAQGATSFTDSTSKLWTLNGSVALTNRDIRFWGEVSSWPQTWDTAGRDVFMAIEAAGVMRRLGQGVSPVQSLLRRTLGALPNLRAYWPCEDVVGSTVLASAVSGVLPMTINTATSTPNLATNSDFVASLPIPEFNGTAFSANLPTASNTGDIQVRFLLSVPAGGAIDTKVICRIYTAGTAQRWDLLYNTGGALTLIAYDFDGTQLMTSGAVAFGINGQPLRMSIELDGTGSTVAWRMTTMPIGANVGLTNSGTLSSNTVLRCTGVRMNVQLSHQDVAVGHITVESAISAFSSPEVVQLNAYVGETAGRRIQRLCREQSVAIQGFGDLDDTAAMGPQTPLNLLDLLKECAGTDMGILGESRAVLGISYRPRTSLYNQAAGATFPYGSLPPGLVPTEDDANTRNDVTVSRPGGSSARYTLQSGTLSTAAPPLGVGTYDDSLSINVARDDDLPDQASWRVHLGTVDEARFPAVEIGLEYTSAAVTAALAGLDLGDRIVLSSPPALSTAPGDVSQLVQGTTETINQKKRRIVFKCSPESPWRPGVYVAAASSTASKYSSDGSTLAAGVSSSATSMSVATPSGPLWTTDPAEMPMLFRLAGEEISVGAISGTSSPQTFSSITRSVNGVVKAQTINTVVELFQPAVYAI